MNKSQLSLFQETLMAHLAVQSGLCNDAKDLIDISEEEVDVSTPIEITFRLTLDKGIQVSKVTVRNVDKVTADMEAFLENPLPEDYLKKIGISP